MKNTYHVIGLMSGTSLDGLDLAYCKFNKNDQQWSFELLKGKSIAYKEAFKAILKNTINLPASELLHFNNQYGTWLGKQVDLFIKDHNLSVDFIASHGHTVFHQTNIGLTYQIGSGQHLANTSGIKTICDFRTNDVALGGQGAPLVPIGDALLFSDYKFCLNLGGISNISFNVNNERNAYDIAPVNMLLNYLTNKINLDYDKGGAIAAKGNLNPELLEKLNALEFYKLPYPKSLGYEWFSEQVLPIVKCLNDTSENLLNTAVHHITDQIAKSINMIKYTPKDKLLITGGGAKNSFLIEVLAKKLPRVDIVVPDENIIDFKEAIVFAFMGVLRDLNEINCLKSVTGARKDSSSGVIFYPS
ncbi:anhydro-N-acetylmuramic acid kinase [Zhouia amylolytica]|uniref:Anhydro-N-acetylmuramic acid kinase n=1 Tax=Zhouia amylolytica TaxID=376730 RepID=A0A1I6V1P6_9FLAO|nr:anhydro-N-acetylmuramic acid kinase [Zhouia amylolytica]MCQ0110075.1 anhydro-N-acetylmuramic acid kinase [Zhouia amylolytica]SFT07622.1 anhydro-N-acetylmuramic acid kinase [Zhouia amylolytica]